MHGMCNPIIIPDSEIEITAIRPQGAGGQNINKVSSTVHLRFDIRASSLPEAVKERLLALRDQRITAEGVIIIKAHRGLESAGCDCAAAWPGKPRGTAASGAASDQTHPGFAEAAAGRQDAARSY